MSAGFACTVQPMRRRADKHAVPWRPAKHSRRFEGDAQRGGRHQRAPTLLFLPGTTLLTHRHESDRLQHMSKRLQVLFPDHEWREIKRAARARQLTVAEWVRQALRAVRREQPGEPTERKLRVVAEATRGSYPTGDIAEMLGEIERGYGGDSA